MKNTNTVKTTSKFKRTVAASLAAVMMMTTAATISASADTQAAVSMNTNSAQTRIVREQYLGHDITPGSFTREGTTINFKYTDGFFETDPKMYNPHMATTSAAMTKASVNYATSKGNYTNAADCIKSVLKQEGFGDVFISDSYTKKPTTDSIACAIGKKEITLNNKKTKTVVSVTVRSGSYEQEWASNVKLGKSGEAEGFAEAANKVTGCIEDYIRNNKLEADAAQGKVVFWVQGFSRGAAASNLTAKRLIDKYESSTVYAYCFAAPQGGVASAERKDRDYTCIHNVVNIDDIVTYVAPTAMGFKRYGVDHFLNDETFDSTKLRKDNFYKNNISDNDGYAKVTTQRLELVRKFVTKIEGSAKADHMPYSMYDEKTGHNTNQILSKLVGNLTRSISREQYVSSGLEDAIRRMMKYFNSGVKLDDLKNAVDIKSTVLSTAANLYGGKLFLGARIVGALGTFFVSPLTAIKMLTPPQFSVDAIAAALRTTLGDNTKLCSLLSTYEGGAPKALDDLIFIAKNGLNGFSNLHELIFFFSNGLKIGNNHSFTQYLAWLESYDSWFEPTAVEYTVSGSTAPVALAA